MTLLPFDSPPSGGVLSVRVVEAEYDEEYLDAPPRTFCSLWLLEKVKWRRRKSKVWGHAEGEKPFEPKWQETFVFDDVRDDTRLAVDVWNVRDDDTQDEFFGKASISLADALMTPVAPWFELLPGRIQLALTWTPYLDGGTLGSSVALTMLASSMAYTVPTGADPIHPPASSLATATRVKIPASPSSPMDTRMEEPAMPTLRPGACQSSAPSMSILDRDRKHLLPTHKTNSAAGSPGVTKSPCTAARAALEVQAQAYEDEEFEEDCIDNKTSNDDGKTPYSVVTTSTQPQYFEYTHRGGSGHGPKENQDAYFLHHIDDHNAIFGVMDGHGHDHGRIAAWAAANAMKQYLIDNFDMLRSTPDHTMTECFEVGHKAVYAAIEKVPGVYASDGILVQDVDEDDWPLGYDAADGGTTASVGALLDGRTLVYAAAGDSCGLLGIPPGKHGGAMACVELVPEHSPTNMNDWVQNLHSTGVHVVFDHEAMFDDQPSSLVPIFTPTATGSWEIAQSTLDRADSLGCGTKTERGDRAAVIMTPEAGRFSQMMLGVSRSLGDFYHQRYGVTWRPEVVVKDLREECQTHGSNGALIIIASDGVWDHWAFDEAMTELLLPNAGIQGSTLSDEKRITDFFELTRRKGEEAFGDGADNLTGIVAMLTVPAAR